MSTPARLEYKYLVPSVLLDTIRTEITPFVDVDAFAEPLGQRGYTVRSVYYDTRRMMCYHEKIEGLSTRKKFRIRGYDLPIEDTLVFLEIKRKRINYIAKSRAALRWEKVHAVLESHHPERLLRSMHGNCLGNAESFLYYYHLLCLKPTVLVVYDREAFQGHFDNSLRITFDKNLRSAPFPALDALFSRALLPIALREHFILEVKFYGGLPLWLRSLTERYQLPRMALSKYTICLDSHRQYHPYSELPVTERPDFQRQTQSWSEVQSV